MKKKLLTLILVGIMSISTIACGDSSNSESANQETVEDTDEPTEEPDASEESEDLSELDSLGDIEVEKELFDVNITLPAEYVGDTTQEELDASAEEYGYKIVLNEDGSATYTMTKSQHKQFLADYKETLNSALQEMVGSEDYPNVTAISANDNFTEFTVTTTSTELDLNESFSVMAFYMYGGIYNIFTGESVDNIHVDFVNADSGEIISSSDSAEAGE